MVLFPSFFIFNLDFFLSAFGNCIMISVSPGLHMHGIVLVHAEDTALSVVGPSGNKCHVMML